MTDRHQMPTLEDVQARIDFHKAQIADLEKLKASLEVAASMWVKIAAEDKHGVRLPTPKRSLLSKRPIDTQTRYDWIIEALKAPRRRWQSANDIQDYIFSQTTETIPMTSLSPALSYLKNEGVVVRAGRMVRLSKREKSSQEASRNSEKGASEESESQDQDDEFSDLI